MPKGIDRFVSENRDQIRKIDATFIPISTQSTKNLSFKDSEIQVNVQIEVYTRPINNSLISGHPNGSVHGSGEGVSGDQRGSWTLETDTEQSKDFVQSGRNNVRDVLAGDTTGAVRQTAVGTDTADANPANTALGNETGREFAWGKQGENANESVAESIFLFHEFGDAVSEYGVYSDGGTIYNRIVTSSVNPSSEEELRTETTFKVTGDGLGSSVITNTGEERIAASLRSIDSAIGLQDLAFGDGSTTPSKSDTSLDNQLFSKIAEQQKDPEVVTAHTVVFDFEPAGQPVDISEIGVFDNSGNLIWRTTVETFEKDDQTEFEVFAGFRAK